MAETPPPQLPPPPPPPPPLPRRVAFPEEGGLVTSYLDPPLPFTEDEEISAEDLIIEYKKSCEKHKTVPIESVLLQLMEKGTLGGSTRRGTLVLAGNALTPAASEALESIFRRTRFQRIDIHDCSLIDEAAIALFDMIEYYESTVELDISGNKGFGILAWQACSRMINKCQWLEQLEIRETSLSESSAPVLGRGLRTFCSLRCLHLERSHLTGPPLLCLSGVMKHNKSIRELHLGDNNLVASDAKHLASMLRINTSLQMLDISNNDIQDSGIEAIADALIEQSSKQFSSSSGSSSESSLSSPQSSSSGSVQERGLIALVVWNNNLTRNSGNHFSKTLSHCHSLEMLNMGQNPLCSETVNRLKSALLKNRSLLSLGMQSTRLGAEAAIALAEIIEDNPVIQRIDLRDNKLQAAGLLALATALKKNQTVTRIDLDDAPPSQADKEHPLEEARLVSEIRSRCRENEMEQSPRQASVDEEENLSAQRKKIISFSTRKISLTCQTLHSATEPILSPPKVTGRLRSPLPSPIPSPASSPIPSPAHRSRFQVSRVSDSSSGTSQSPSPSTPPGPRTFFPGTSRFRVVSVSDMPSISVQAPDDSVVKENSPVINVSSQTDDSKVVKFGSSRFSIVRNVDVGNAPVPKSTKSDKIKSVHSRNEDNLLLDNKPGSVDHGVNAATDSRADKKSKSFTAQESERNYDAKLENITKPQSSNKYPYSMGKNKSESSLDSPDMEVSRLMEHEKKNVYDSNSSLDISGSSMESLNTIDNKKQTKASNVHSGQGCNLKDLSVDSEEGDVFGSVDEKPSRRSGNLSLSSNESSLDLSAPVEVPHGNVFQFSNQPFLHSSVSSNDSVSPNIFGKHMKLHGSVTSLEASVSSLDSFKSGSNTMISPITQNPEIFNFSSPEQTHLMDSTDSGIFQSENSPKTINSSISSNEGTLTMNSSLSKIAQSLSSASEASGSSNSPKSVSSLLDVPSSGSKQRNRKISWVSPGSGSASSSNKKEVDDPQQKTTSNLEKLFSLFQIPHNLFSRNANESNEKKESHLNIVPQNNQNQLPSTSGSFWPWSSATIPSKIMEKNSNATDSPDLTGITSIDSTNINSVPSVSAEYTINLDESKGLQRTCSFGESDNNQNENTDAEVFNLISTESNSERENPLIKCDSPKSVERLCEIEKSPSEASDDNLNKNNEVLNCDNLVVENNMCTLDSVEPVGIFRSNAEIIENKPKNDGVAVKTCDNVRVQSEITDDTHAPIVTTSTIPDDSIITKDLVQNNLLLSVCDNDRRSESVIYGSQSDDACSVSSMEYLNTKCEDSVSTKSPCPERDTLVSVKKYDGRNISRDLSVSSVTSSTNDTDTDNSPNTFDCHISNDNLNSVTTVVTSSIDENIFAESDRDPKDDRQEDQRVASSRSKDVDETGSQDRYSRDGKSDLSVSVMFGSKESFAENMNIYEIMNIGVEGKVSAKYNIDELVKPTHISLPGNEITVNLLSERSPSSVLKQSIGIENKTAFGERQLSPDSGQSIENLPSKIIKRIKENISPENTLTSSMSNTQALAQELAERRKNISVNASQWKENIESVDFCFDETFTRSKRGDGDAKNASIDATGKSKDDVQSGTSAENQIFSANVSTLPGETGPDIPIPESDVIHIDDNSIKIVHFDCEYPCLCTRGGDASLIEEGKDALTVSDLSFGGDCDAVPTSALLQNENSSIIGDMPDDNETSKDENESASPANRRAGVRPVSILKNANARSVRVSSPKDIPDPKGKLHKSCDSCERDSPFHHCGSLPETCTRGSPKSLPKTKSPSPLTTLGKLARDSLYGLNMSDEEIAGVIEDTRLGRVRSLSSVSEDAGDTFPLDRGRSPGGSKGLGAFTSEESLASSASISEPIIESDEAEISRE